MKYYVEIFDRLKGAFPNAAGGYLEYAANIALFKAGIARNSISTAKNETEYKPEVYDDSNILFGDIVFSAPGMDDISLSTNAGSLAPPPFIRLTRKKETSITVIDSGNENEIIESFGINSWQISMDGIVIDTDNHQYPQSAIRRIVELFNLNDVIDVSCDLLNDTGIYSLWFEEQTIEPLQGFPDTVKYSFRARSIKPDRKSTRLNSSHIQQTRMPPAA